MASREQDNSRIVSVRLPAALIRRLDRYLDWSEISGRDKSSRNAALREALRLWLDHHEQLAGFISPAILHGQFRAAYNHVAQGHAWVAISRLRQHLQWPQERFDAVLEGLRADRHVELDRAQLGEIHATDIHDSYVVHGHLYRMLRWCD
jgi:metal-responsive CopG/Arc/MetJ family transcriptional regulator